MKNVLISIKPKYVEFIVSGKKTVEVSRTRPKCETPFKVYIYCTMGNLPKYIYNEKLEKESVYEKHPEIINGKVIGEFVCDRIINGKDGVQEWVYITEESCVPCNELYKYCGEDNEGNTNYCYGWHITDLVVYDEPRELSEFCLPCDHENDCGTCKRAIYCSSTRQFCRCDLEDGLKRPPQSWCYIEPRQTAD